MPAFARGGDAVTGARVMRLAALAGAMAVSCGGGSKVLYEGTRRSIPLIS